MCKNELCFEKCKMCGEKGYTCCRTQPLMSEEELARIHYEVGIPQDVTVTRVEGGYIVVPNSVLDENGNANITKETCVFYDKKEHKCSIYDLRPKTCRDFGEVDAMPCPFKELSLEEFKNKSDEELDKLAKEANKIKSEMFNYILKRKDVLSIKPLYKISKLDKKYLKNLKELMILSVVIYYLNEVTRQDSKRFEITHTYRLGLLPNGKLSSIRIDKVRALDSNFKIIEKLHNFLYNKIMTLPPDLIEVVVSKVNRIIDGIAQKECKFEEDDAILYYLMSVVLFKQYLVEYKNKSKQFVGVIKHQELMDFIKYVAEITGSKTDSKFMFTGVVDCVMKNADMLYRAVIKNK